MTSGKYKHKKGWNKMGLRANIRCLCCGKDVEVVPSQKMRKYCSMACRDKDFKKRKLRLWENNPRWKGGKAKHSAGYLMRRVKNHPNVNNNGYIGEHRLVMEEFLGRFLEAEEVVHHKNHKRDDNRIENLELFPTRKAHSSYHLLKRIHQTNETYEVEGEKE